jgi:acetylornithine/succinyldiaminopimelate/putrescine aminotransferase
VLWFAGGQLGHIFIDDAHYVDKPLTLISTWGGDEIGIMRAHHHLLETRTLLTQHRGAVFARAVDDANLPGKRHGGGLWQVVDVGEEAKADAMRKGALRRGLRLATGLPGRLVLAPLLCVSDDDIKQGLSRLERAMREAG